MAGFVFDLASAPSLYAELGFDTLPLVPGTKQASKKAWQSRPSTDLWENAVPNANVGIRCGGNAQIGVIDCDDKSSPETAQKVIRYFGGIGLELGDFPLIRTASGEGRHLYLRIEDAPKSMHYQHLHPEIGAGEFRYGSGAYVVAPPSVLGVADRYELLVGDFARLPTLRFRDLVPIIKTNNTEGKDKTSRKLSRNAFRLLRGDITSQYPSRSEAEQALVVSLINTGFEWSEIHAMFIGNPGPGKFQELYRENPSNADRYLYHSYSTAVRWSRENTSEGRQIAEVAIEWALSRPWQGRTGAYDRDVFLAHAQIAWDCGKIVYAASSRGLAELANVSHVAASNATNRLIDKGLVFKEKSAVAQLANKYSLKKTFTLPQLQPVRKCKGSINSQIKHDVFSYQGLGKSSKLLLWQLETGPKTVDELVSLTGKTKLTVEKRLKRMSKIVDFQTGELFSLVAEEDGKWLKLEGINLDRIAEILNVAGIQEKRKRTHRLERQIHAESLKRGRKK